MAESLNILFEHVARTLPALPSDQRRLLQAMVNVLPTDHPGNKAAAGIIAAIDFQQKLQTDLPLYFQPSKQGESPSGATLHNGQP